MLLASPDESFHPLYHAVGCFCVHERSILLLRRKGDRSYPFAWGIPTGKVEAAESPFGAMIREIFEETGLVRSEDNLSFLREFRIRDGNVDFTYTAYATEYETRPDIRLSAREHSESRWIDVDRLRDLAVVPDLVECFEEVRQLLVTPSQLELFPSGAKSGPARRLGAIEAEIAAEMVPLAAMQASAAAQTTVVIGPPAVGKTTLCKGLVERGVFREVHHDERFLHQASRQHRTLARYLCGDSTAALACQVESLLSRCHQAVMATSSDLMDESALSTLAYARVLWRQGDLSDDEYATFYSAYCVLAHRLPSPRCLIHLTSSVEPLWRRVGSRGRSLERNFTWDYLANLVHAFGRVEEEARARGVAHVLRVDSSHMSKRQCLDAVVALLGEGI